MTHIPDPLQTAEKAMALIDDSFESREEAEGTRTERLKIDITSPYKLPHLIRPYAFIWAIVNETILTWATIALVFFGTTVDPQASVALMAALAANTAILTAIVGFYFNSRKMEKNLAKQMAGQLAVTQLKAKTAVKIEAIKAKADIANENADSRLDRKERKRLFRRGLNQG